MLPVPMLVATHRLSKFNESNVNVLAQIQDEIRTKGPMTFARFMELALYSPSGGYYESNARIGRAGDFYTSVSVGPLFGELLARQFSSWLRETGATELIEVGAHDGTLARDILGWFAAEAPDAFKKLRYTIVEPSTQRRAWQQKALGNFLQHVDWRAELPSGVRGIIFSNELLDAMPVHRLKWDAQRKQWREWMITVNKETLAWTDAELSPGLDNVAPHVPNELADVLLDGFTTEVSPAAMNWWTHAAEALAQGRLVAVDYGLMEHEFFRPDRRNGTARSYHKHRYVDDLLSNPGEQDVTAHVNWTAMQRVGERAGLSTELFLSQEQFLMRSVKECAAENWPAEKIRQLQTLIHPSLLGRAFQVLVQKRS
jgi:SAM-dependent MidA family methyltransferase